MKPALRGECPECGAVLHAPVVAGAAIACRHCGYKSGELPPPGELLKNPCLLCGCPAYYRQKNFPQALGCFVLAAGAALVPWTYGMSLPVLAAVDWLLARRIRDMAVCYQCRTEYRRLRLPASLAVFDHSRAWKHEAKYRHSRAGKKAQPQSPAAKSAG